MTNLMNSLYKDAYRPNPELFGCWHQGYDSARIDNGGRDQQAIGAVFLYIFISIRR